MVAWMHEHESGDIYMRDQVQVNEVDSAVQSDAVEGRKTRSTRVGDLIGNVISSAR